MGKLKPVPIVGGAYADDCAPWTDQDTCNWLPVVAEGDGTRSSAILRTPPGLQPFAAVPGAARQRGGYVAEGRLFFVADTTLYQQMPNGTINSIGTVPGTGRVQFTHNKVGGNIEVFVGAGSWGGIYSSDTNTLTQITDAGFHGAKAVGYIGHLFLAVSPSGKEFQNSDLDDGSSWNALEVYEGESKPDRIVSLAVSNGEVVLLNERSLDHFAYTGETNALFQNKLIPIDRGCASANAVVSLDNALFFLGDDGTFYEKRGYELRRVSTHAIEQAWSECDLSKSYAFGWEDKGHKVAYITFPDGGTWGYDVASRQWHRRESWDQSRWRLAWLVKWNGDWYGGEHNTGTVFKLVWGYVLEGSERIKRSRTSGVLHDNQNRLTLNTLEIVVEACGEATTATSALSFVLGGSLVDCAVGDVIDYSYSIVGGVPPFTASIVGGTLPAGLSFDPDTLRITGTTTTAEHDNAWSLQVVDSTPTTATLPDTCYVLDMLGTPPNAVASTAYSYTLTGTEGTAPYTFVKTSGTLPTGITFSSGGVFGGTAPATLAAYPLVITMTDALGVDIVKDYTLSVIADPAIPIALGAFTRDWYTMDSTEVSAVYSAIAFTSNWSGYGAVSSYQTGMKGQEAILNEVSRVSGAGAQYAHTVGADFFFTFWGNVVTSTDGIINVGLARNTAPGIDRNPFQTVRVVVAAGVATASSHTFDYGPPQVYANSAGTTVSAGRHRFGYSYKGSTKTVSLWIDDAVAATATLLTHPPLEAYSWIAAMADSQAAGTALVMAIDEFNLFLGTELTAAYAAYLWNYGDGKSKAEFYADAGL